MRRSFWFAILFLTAGASEGRQVAAETAGSASPAAVNASRMENADQDPGQWMSYGRTWSEQRFSPLTQINARNVKRLGLAWYADLNTYRGVDATPLVIDGVLYNISAWDITTAYEATTGKVLWTYDPKIPLEWARLACCGPVSRGLAAWNGKIILGVLDGRLIALDARTGTPVWSTQTLDKGQPLSITGAPRVANGVVVIGNGGGDFGARGYMSAYDAETGKQQWKFYIVPGDPAAAPDGVASDSVMPMAAKTWTGEWWKVGGGGNNWDTIVYDPKVDLVYFGTGNGSPHPQALRSPDGGDNLFLCSIVAVNAKTGKYVWHYQEVPAEEWDYDCTSPLMLADLTIDGRARQVIMHAPKNGFFYVLDRATGEIISANNFVPNTWASHIDLKTGRPAVNPEALVQEKPYLMTPTAAHNWNPMSYSPVQSVPVAGPISYSVNGKQYIGVNAGWNNAIVHGLNSGPTPFSVSAARLVVFALDAKGVKLPPAPPAESITPPPAAPQPDAKVREGAVLFSANCAICHGQNAVGSGPKDLRYLNAQAHIDFNDIVLSGKLKDRGMAPFADLLTPEQADAIHAFVISRGQEDWQPVFGPPPKRQ